MTLSERFRVLSLKRQDTIFSASLVLVITFAASAVLGLLRSRFLNARFFNCCLLELDAYNAAFRLPDLIFKLLVTGALSASFIPVFSTYLHKDKEMANKIGSTVINLLLITLTIISLIVFIFANQFSHLIAGGFNSYQIELMSNLTRILLIAQIFFLVSNFLTGILQVHQVFIVPALSPIVYNFFIILSIFTLVPYFGIYGVVYGAVVGAFFHLIIQIPVARKIGFDYSLIFNPKLTGVREIINLMIPRSLSLGLGEIENTITLFFASTLTIGSISLLNLALQIMYLPSRIFGTTVGQASLPILSKSVANNKLDEFRHTVFKTIIQSLFIATPVASLVLVLRLPIVRLAFGSRQFPWTATLLTARTLGFLTPAIILQALTQILIRAFYALHNTKTPLKISFISLVINILSSYFFVHYTNLGIVGLAVSATIGNIIQSFGLFYLFIHTVDGFNYKIFFPKVIKIIFNSVFMALTTYGTLKILDLFILDTAKTVSVLILFIISLVVGFVSYYLFSRLFTPEELKPYHHLFQKYVSRLFISPK